MLDHLLLIKVLAESFSLELEIRTITFFFLFDKGQNHKFEKHSSKRRRFGLTKGFDECFQIFGFDPHQKGKKNLVLILGKMILLWSSGFTRLGFS
jgi:hypothetical protein